VAVVVPGLFTCQAPLLWVKDKYCKMNVLWRKQCIDLRPWLWALPGLLLLAFILPAQGQLVLSELFLNPPGPDLPNEYIELRGQPNSLIADGTYLVVLEGDTNGNPGVVQNVFDLSELRVGGNGYVVLLQKTNSYLPDPGALILENTDTQEGFGSGSGSSIDHDGEGGQLDLENGSSTFLLIEAPDKPSPGEDVDADNDGIPEAEFYAAWTILDSVGILDNDGLGDITYGAITFQNAAASHASGIVVPVSFTPDYLGRIGLGTGSDPEDWVASNQLTGSPPDWVLGDDTETIPLSLADAPLDHIGGPNFGAAGLPGVLLKESDDKTTVEESIGTDQYTLALNTDPAGPVTMLVTIGMEAELSLDGGTNYVQETSLTFTNTDPVDIFVRARADIAVEPSPHFAVIHHAVTNSADPVPYPLELLIPDVTVRILDDDRALLSEIKVNPPGTNDVPYEFIELLGVPQAPLSGVKVLAIEGDLGGDPGKVSVAFDLDGLQFGSNGLILIMSTNLPYAADPETTVVASPLLDVGDGGLENGTTSYLLIATATAIPPGDDLDKGDNGVLEGMPEDTHLLDAVGWSDGGQGDIVFGGVELLLSTGTPDAASRIPGNTTPLDPDAWRAGNLLGESGTSLLFDPSRSTTNVPAGTALNPGRFNNSAPHITALPSLAGAIGDPTNPDVLFDVLDAESLLDGLMMEVTSDNPVVVPDTNLVVSELAPGRYNLHVEPIGVGYATITIAVDDGDMTGLSTFRYAASEAGTPDSRYHVGASDASTAMVLSPDLMLVGDDETQLIRLYSRHVSGPPITGFQMNPFLALTDFEDDKPREVDIEGSTHVGDRIYWTGSHSHADIGEIRTNRARIFATDLIGTDTNATIEYVGHYEHLKADLVVWDSSDAHGKGANYYGFADSTAAGVLPKEPTGAGFNIEGLTMAPGSTNVAWLGFRAPIVPATNRLYALIVPVLNFTDLAISNSPIGSARFGEPIELDLQGRGIRSFEGDTNGFLLITGPPGNIPTPAPPSDFKIYTWSGESADQPLQHDLDLTGLNPEAIIELPPHPWTESSQVQIMSDNGRTIFYDDGIPGKQLPDANFKKSRSDIFPLGPVVAPRPFFTSVLCDSNQVHLTWRSVPGLSYQLQSKSDLGSPNWDDEGPVLLATATLTSAAIPLLPDDQRFLQVLVVEDP